MWSDFLSLSSKKPIASRKGLSAFSIPLHQPVHGVHHFDAFIVAQREAIQREHGFGVAVADAAEREPFHA